VGLRARSVAPHVSRAIFSCCKVGLRWQWVQWSMTRAVSPYKIVEMQVARANSSLLCGYLRYIIVNERGRHVTAPVGVVPVSCGGIAKRQKQRQFSARPRQHKSPGVPLVPLVPCERECIQK
jgi:hypothetical protein